MERVCVLTLAEICVNQKAPLSSYCHLEQTRTVGTWPRAPVTTGRCQERPRGSSRAGRRRTKPTNVKSCALHLPLTNYAVLLEAPERAKRPHLTCRLTPEKPKQTVAPPGVLRHRRNGAQW